MRVICKVRSRVRFNLKVRFMVRFRTGFRVKLSVMFRVSFRSWVRFRVMFRLRFVSRSSLGLKSILKMPGLEPGTFRLSMLSECAYHLRYIPVDPNAHTHSISRPDLAGLPGLQF